MNFLYRLFELLQVSELHIHMKRIAEVAAGNGHRLEFGEVHAAGGNLTQHPGQAPFRVVGGEVDGGFIGKIINLHGFGPLQHQEAGEVIFLGMDIRSDDAEAKEFGSQFPRYSRRMAVFVLGDEAGAEGGIFRFHQFPVMFFKETKALLQGHGVRVHFADIFQPYARVSQQLLADGQVNLAGNFQLALYQQGIVWQDTAGDRVFNGHQGAIGNRFIGCGFYQFGEAGTAHKRQVLTKKLLRCQLVKAALKALYGDPFVHLSKKKSRLLAGNLYVNYVVSVNYKSFPAYYR